MRNIEIDFEVFKALTAKRSSESISENDVLRELLNLPPRKPSVTEMGNGTGKPFITEGVEFPHGTDFRMKYRSQWFTGKVSDGGLVVNGTRYTAVSAPACAITKNARNGWRDWECKFPGESTWQTISSVRHHRQRQT